MEADECQEIVDVAVGPMALTRPPRAIFVSLGGLRLAKIYFLPWRSVIAACGLDPAWPDAIGITNFCRLAVRIADVGLVYRAGMVAAAVAQAPLE
ncbi:hypothetical protein A1356_02015 [Methylomonas koyamae]|uniref:Uncharacterized protein n=1 Tax=Methylomonas koyamae TaxID=702114 RepID=A0AA91I3J3_9GAMM|nr:hypothetical protein A1356_02015 [Methylomonas koyamae]